MTTSEIKLLLNDVHLDFETVVTIALNEYLPRIFPICPFNERPCIEKQCHECKIFKNHLEIKS